MEVFPLHLFLYGHSGVGKTTLIRHAMQNCGLAPAAGFITYKENNNIYIKGIKANSPEYWVASCDESSIIEKDPAVFDLFAAKHLNYIPKDSLVLMDELGFLESEAKIFRRQILDILDYPCRIIGVIKEKSNPFLEEIKNHPLVRTQFVNEKNRSEVLQTIENFFRQKNIAAELGLLSLPSQKRVISFIGSGGKTTLIYLLARELAAEGFSVIITSTTKMKLPEPYQAPFIEYTDNNRATTALLQKQKITATGITCPEGKFTLPTDKIKFLAAADFVLVEADGSKNLPCKAWADYEPVIPSETNSIIHLAGLTCLNQPLYLACHRPRLAAAVLNRSLNHIISSVDLAELISRKAKQIKEEFPQALYKIILNQGDAVSFSQAKATAREIRRLSDLPVIITALKTISPLIYKNCQED